MPDANWHHLTTFALTGVHPSVMVIVPPWTSAPQVKVTPSFCPVAQLVGTHPGRSESTVVVIALHVGADTCNNLVIGEQAAEAVPVDST